MTPAAVRWLAFRVGSLRAALPLSLVREVLPAADVVPVPGARPQVSGVFMKGGVAVPVYDLARFEALWAGAQSGAGAPRAGGRRQLILCDWSDLVLALLGEDVDLLEGAGLEETDDGTDKAPVRREFVRGMMHGEDGAVAVLDPGHLFESMGVPAAPGVHAAEGDGEKDPARR